MPEILEFDKMFYKNFEPKLGNRFIMEINGIESYIIKTAARPTFTSEIIELDHITDASPCIPAKTPFPVKSRVGLSNTGVPSCTH